MEYNQPHQQSNSGNVIYFKNDSWLLIDLKANCCWLSYKSIFCKGSSLRFIEAIFS